MTNLNHPDPLLVASACEQLARTLRRTGTQAIRMGKILSARGWSPQTLGSFGRSADTTSSTERAALNPDGWADIDATIARQMRLALWNADRLMNVLEQVMAHASDDDPVPAGTGECLRCATFCRPTAERPEFRIKAGFCPACYQTWVRHGRPDRTDFVLSYNTQETA